MEEIGLFKVNIYDEINDSKKKTNNIGIRAVLPLFIIMLVAALLSAIFYPFLLIILIPICLALIVFPSALEKEDSDGTFRDKEVETCNEIRALICDEVPDRVKFIEGALKFMNYKAIYIDSDTWIVNESILLYDAYYRTYEYIPELAERRNIKHIYAIDEDDAANTEIRCITTDDIFEALANKLAFDRKYSK